MFRNFDYSAPGTFRELFSLLGKEDCAVLAGGTDLVVNLRSGKIRPAHVADIKKLTTLKNIRKTSTGLEIGSLVTMAELAGSQYLKKGPYSLLGKAASIMGCSEIRNRATLGGNIINASPGGETITPLTVLEAKVELRSASGRRTVKVDEFIDWVNSTKIKKGEILTKILLPKLPASARGTYMRRQRGKGMDLASVNCSVLVLGRKRGKNSEVRISVGAVSPVPYRARQAESYLAGKDSSDETLKKAADIINSEIEPRKSSLRATPGYKKNMIFTFLRSAFDEIEAKS